MKDLVEAQLEQCTLVAALRRRRSGDPAPALGETWGIGPRLADIGAHWQAALFGLGAVFPWLAEALMAHGVPSDTSCANFILARFADADEAQACDAYLKKTFRMVFFKFIHLK